MKEINLYIHIGHGKTGTTSIQQFFRKNRVALEKKGYLYTGLLFEELTDYVETTSSVQHIFNKISGEGVNLENDIEEGVQSLLKYSHENNIENIIWVNEAFLTNGEKFIPIIRKFKSRFNMKIVCYLRDQYSWFSSSYKQWGVKDKNYQGDVQSFKEWCESQKWQGMYYNLLCPWDSEFDRDSLIIKNYVEVKDVLGDFLTIIGLMDFKDKVAENNGRSNVSDTSAILSFYKVFNSIYHGADGYLIANKLLNKIDVTFGLMGQGSELFSIPDYDDVSYLFKDFKANNDLLLELIGTELPVVSGEGEGVKSNEIETLSLMMGLILKLSNELSIVEEKLSRIDHKL